MYLGIVKVMLMCSIFLGLVVNQQIERIDDVKPVFVGQNSKLEGSKYYYKDEGKWKSHDFERDFMIPKTQGKVGWAMRFLGKQLRVGLDNYKIITFVSRTDVNEYGEPVVNTRGYRLFYRVFVNLDGKLEPPILKSSNKTQQLIIPVNAVFEEYVDASDYAVENCLLKKLQYVPNTLLKKGDADVALNLDVFPVKTSKGDFLRFNWAYYSFSETDQHASDDMGIFESGHGRISKTGEYGATFVSLKSSSPANNFDDAYYEVPLASWNKFWQDIGQGK
jgi:hypothetical protein